MKAFAMFMIVVSGMIASALAQDAPIIPASPIPPVNYAPPVVESPRKIHHPEPPPRDAVDEKPPALPVASVTPSATSQEKRPGSVMRDAITGEPVTAQKKKPPKKWTKRDDMREKLKRSRGWDK